MGTTLRNTAIIVLPALFFILLLSSMLAFACTRFSWKFNIAFLVLFTAGNLLPQQVMFQPLFQIFDRTPWPDWLSGGQNNGVLLGTQASVILTHIAFQTGFCTFVLANYMKTIPKELSEAAAVDGASVPRQFFQVILPLTRPALAALATLEFTWLYNDFFWGSVLLNQGDQRPITSSIAVLNGQYATDFNLIAAASLIIAMPTLLVYLMLQKQFIGGLTLGSTKG
jgi:multiple sugar transport system permease protein